jgi:nucleoside-diphosphate-sugar epimerase
MRRALVTGAAGFVGRHMHRALQERGYHVLAVDLTPAPGVMPADALDLFRTDTTKYDLAVHCAAVVGGRASIDGSPLAVATNLALDAWFFRWLAASGTRRAVYYSSSAVYPVELQQPGPIRLLAENDVDLARPGRPDATYGLVKLAGEQLAPYAEAAGCRVHILRPFSGYGTDQSEDYPFPAFIDRARRREDPFEVWGSGDSTRDWIHIDDVVGATLAAIDEDFTGPVNLGWGRPTPFDELARLVTRGAGYAPEITHLADAPAGVHHRVCDPARMHTFYRPTVSLEEGIIRALAATVH